MTVTFAFDPDIVRVGALSIGWHGIFTAVAVFVAVGAGLRGAERIGFSSDRLTGPLTWAIVGGMVGARLFHVADHLAYYVAHPLEALAIYEGGIAVYGAFIGGIVAGAIAARRAGLPIPKLLDIAAPAMLIGQAIGRLGCLSNGDAWGAPTGTDYGIVYTNPNDRLPADLLGVPTHPYPAYEIVAALALLGLLWLLRRERVFRVDGQLFAFAALGYAAIRFSLTFFRQETIVWAGLQEAQVISLVAGAAAIAALALLPLRAPAQVGGNRAS
ncbi:MAG: prolipoprotein diacylglyceryl transferase [Chloroflexota bacterium]|nr:prolipoprotein diacylglyceryl transferase [Chloroflexota bacterium]